MAERDKMDRDEKEKGRSTRSGGNMGAGKSGVEGLGTEKAVDELGSHEPDSKVAHRLDESVKEPNRHDQPS